MKTKYQLLVILFTITLILALAVPTALAKPAKNDIQALYKGDIAFAQIEALTDFGPRVAGGPAEKAAAKYIADQMASYGLSVEIQEFPITYWDELSPAVLEQVSPIPTPYTPWVDFATMSYSGAGDVTAPLQAVDLLIPPTGGSTSGCEAADFAGFVPGNVALMQRGTCTFALKAQNAEAAGAAGAIIFNEGNTPDRTGLLSGTLGGPGVTIPAVGTTYQLGFDFYTLLLSGPVTVHLKVDTVGYPSTSQNVIGTRKGTQPKQGIVYIGAHYDSVPGVVGANDDASGVAAMLEAARVLGTKGHSTKATLKFIAFGAEETGLNGSYAYVAANEVEVSTMGIGMFNLDMVGVGDQLRLGRIGLAGPQLVDFTGATATAMGLTWTTFTAGYNSDHTYFEQVGVPVSFIQQSPDPYFHTPQDTPDKINQTTLEQNGELATASLYDWAKNPVLRAKKAARPTQPLSMFNVYQDRVYANR